MSTTITQDASELGLRWRKGDPISLRFIVEGVDLSGEYMPAQVRRTFSATKVFIELDVSAELDDEDTVFELTASAADSNRVPSGTYEWDMQMVDGPTIFAGPVIVGPQVSRT